MMKLLKRLIRKISNRSLNVKYQNILRTTIPNFSKLYYNTNIVVNQDCSEFEVDINKITTFILHDLIPIVGISPYPINELLLMTSSIAKIKPDYIFEWGTHLGISARIFHEICKKYELDTTIHSIDLPDNIDHIEHPKENRGIKVAGLADVKLHQGDGLDKSMEIAGNLRSDSKFLFFLDGDHEYKSVTRELYGIYKNHPRSSILAHDTFFQSSESKYNIGPNLAIKDFIKKYPNSYKHVSTNLGLPGMTLLYRYDVKSTKK